jgi:hypothetical protein
VYDLLRPLAEQRFSVFPEPNLQGNNKFDVGSDPSTQRLISKNQ